jgi:hypothetical protein
MSPGIDVVKPLHFAMKALSDATPARSAGALAAQRKRVGISGLGGLVVLRTLSSRLRRSLSYHR